MKTKNILIGVFSLMSLLAAANAGDLSGKWSAQIQEGQESIRTIFSFAVDGTKLVGTISGPQGVSPVSEGKIDGNEISFIISRKLNGNTQKLIFRGKVKGDEIDFISKVENSEKQQEFTARRDFQDDGNRPSSRFITLP